MPNQQFGQDLEDQLSGKGTPRPQTAATIPAHTPSGVETTAPDVFVSLSANIAAQSGLSWSFDNVPKDRAE
jgi:hypothetical protein